MDVYHFWLCIKMLGLWWHKTLWMKEWRKLGVKINRQFGTVKFFLPFQK